jgi:uncharacterized protein
LNSKAKLIGLISDTHGLLRPEAVEALRGSELILHVGDVGKPEILEELRKTAPLVAIRGNVDTAPWTASLKETELVETHAANIYMIHNVNDLDRNPVAAGIHIVLFGHSHQPTQYEKNGVLYLNPGSAGPRRFNLPITVACLDLSASPWKFQLIPLDSGA